MTDDTNQTINVQDLQELVAFAAENEGERLEVDAEVVQAFASFLPEDVGEGDMPSASFEQRVDNLLQGTPCEDDTSLRANLIELCKDTFIRGGLARFEHWTVSEGDIVSVDLQQGYDYPTEDLWEEMMDSVKTKIPDSAVLVEGLGIEFLEVGPGDAVLVTTEEGFDSPPEEAVDEYVTYLEERLPDGVRVVPAMKDGFEVSSR